HNLFITNNNNIVLGTGLRFSIEFSSLQVPEDINSFTIHNKALGALFPPKIPRFQLNFTDIKTLWPDLVTAAGSSLGFSPDEKQAGIPIGSCMVICKFETS
ncbi:hypothetical protein QQP08_009268, partial [Theobroma cacao]